MVLFHFWTDDDIAVFASVEVMVDIISTLTIHMPQRHKQALEYLQYDYKRYMEFGFYI